MQSILYKSEPLKEDISVFHSVFFGEWNEIKDAISHTQSCQVHAYAICKGTSRYYLKQIGKPSNYEWFYQAIIDLYVGDVMGDQQKVNDALEYLHSL